MAFSSWLCSNSTKNMFVKIVHPGGHVELHDRPVLAAEIIHRNPRCIVAHPHVFQQPSAIVAPETMLMPGQKFYVVPISTIRKLQRLSFKNSPSPLQDIQSSQTLKPAEKDDNKASNCWLFLTNKNSLKTQYSCLKHTDNEGEKANTGSNARKDMQRDECVSDDNCFLCLLTGIKIKGNGNDSRESSSNFGSSETKGLTKKRTRDITGGPPKRYTSIDHWQPSLQSIREE